MEIRLENIYVPITFQVHRAKVKVRVAKTAARRFVLLGHSLVDFVNYKLYSLFSAYLWGLSRGHQPSSQSKQCVLPSKCRISICQLRGGQRPTYELLVLFCDYKREKPLVDRRFRHSSYRHKSIFHQCKFSRYVYTYRVVLNTSFLLWLGKMLTDFPNHFIARESTKSPTGITVSHFRPLCVTKFK